MPRNKPPVVLIGSGGHAKIIIDLVELANLYSIVGVTTIDPEIETFNNYPVLGGDDVLPSLWGDGIRHAVIGIGGFTNNKLRKSIFEKLKSMGFEIVVTIHPSAVIARDVLIGEGSVLFAGVVLNPGVSIGKNVIIATGSTVDHETLIADHVLVSAGVSIGADVRIEEEALLAIGSTVVSGKKIGRNSLVAAGAVVVRDVEDGIAVAGVPAIQKKIYW